MHNYINYCDEKEREQAKLCVAGSGLQCDVNFLS